MNTNLPNMITAFTARRTKPLWALQNSFNHKNIIQWQLTWHADCTHSFLPHLSKCWKASAKYLLGFFWLSSQILEQAHLGKLLGETEWSCPGGCLRCCPHPRSPDHQRYSQHHCQSPLHLQRHWQSVNGDSSPLFRWKGCFFGLLLPDCWFCVFGLDTACDFGTGDGTTPPSAIFDKLQSFESFVFFPWSEMGLTLVFSDLLVNLNLN